jgi:glycogen operon protein
MDSLRVWVQEFGVDGFRFDLAPVMARGDQRNGYQMASNAAFLMAIAQDPVLSDKLMVAEPWDIGPGGYQLGNFPAGWLEWNDKFRDTQRAFWLCGQEHPGALAQRLAGSTDAFNPQRRSANSSVNFVTAHDGFNLSDVVSYHQRHNEANGEHNRDGHGHNLSRNFGVEGPSSDTTITAQRLQHKRALLAATVFSLGTPMLLAGDDIGHSQQGNNNAYCQDNASTWLNWPDADLELSRFVAHLLQARRARTVLKARDWWQAEGSVGTVVAGWSMPDNTPLTHEAWNDGRQRALALHLQRPHAHVDAQGNAHGVANAGAQMGTQNAACLLFINASDQAQRFRLPEGQWLLHIDTRTGAGTDRALAFEETVPPNCLWLASSSPMFIA